MPTMFKQLFASITMFFIGLEAFASAFAHIGKYTDESAGAFADKARIDRQAQLNQEQKKLSK